MKRPFIFFVLLIINLFIQEAYALKAEHWRTSRGAEVVFYQAMEVPMLDVNVAFAAGSAYDGAAFGLSTLTTDLLGQGSGQFDANQIADKFADIGAQYNGESSRDMVVLQLKTLTEPEALQQAIDTLALIINKPSFKQDAFWRGKNQQLLAVAQQQESPSDVANLLFFNRLYQNHPYAHAINGTTQTINKLNHYQVRSFYQRYFVAKNALIVIVGAINREKAEDIAEHLLHDLPEGEKAAPIPKAIPLAQKESISQPFPSSQTMLRIGQIGIDHHDENYFPLIVGSYILGGGSMNSLLSQELREKRGLTYNVVSQFLPMPGDGPFLISLATKNSKALDALDITHQTLNAFITKGPTEEELSAAKDYLIGSFPLSLASNNNIAGMLLRMAFYQLPDDYLDTYTSQIEAVTADAIKQAFAKRLVPDKFLIVSVGREHQKRGHE